MKIRFLEHTKSTVQEAQELRKTSAAYAILYGWRYKRGAANYIPPEEHTKESLEKRLDLIVNAHSVHDNDNPKKNRYAKHNEFMFFVLY